MVFAVKTVFVSLSHLVGLFFLTFCFPHLTHKIFVLFYHHAFKAEKFYPHMATAVAGRAVEMFTGSGSVGSF